MVPQDSGKWLSKWPRARLEERRGRQFKGAAASVFSRQHGAAAPTHATQPFHELLAGWALTSSPPPRLRRLPPPLQLQVAGASVGKVHRSLRRGRRLCWRRLQRSRIPLLRTIMAAGKCWQRQKQSAPEQRSAASGHSFDGKGRAAIAAGGSMCSQAAATAAGAGAAAPPAGASPHKPPQQQQQQQCQEHLQPAAAATHQRLLPLVSRIQLVPFLFQHLRLL